MEIIEDGVDFVIVYFTREEYNKNFSKIDRIGLPE